MYFRAPDSELFFEEAGRSGRLHINEGQRPSKSSDTLLAMESCQIRLQKPSHGTVNVYSLNPKTQNP